MSKVVGKVTHYFDKIGVAVLALKSPIAVGDVLKISGHDNEFTQTVTSMQLEHKPVEKAKPGQDIAIKVDQPVKEEDEVTME